MSKLEPFPEEALTELRHAQARAQNAERRASQLEASAREARARAKAARQHYDDLFLEHNGQGKLFDEGGLKRE